MARALVPDTQGGVPAIRPQASPVDTFIRQPAAQGSSLGQLASALSGVAPELRQFGQAVSQREADTATAQGEAWAADMQNSKDAWAGLVKDGKIAPSQNPHFVIAAKRKFGEVAASRFDVTLQQSIAKLGDTPSPDQFEQAVSDARSSFLKDNAGAASTDLSFMQGFNPTAEQSIENARRAFAAGHARQFEEDASQAFVQSGNKIIRDSLATEAATNFAFGAAGDVGVKAKPSMVLDNIATKINAEADAWTGVNPAVKRSGTLSNTSIEKLTANMVFNFMKESGNPAVAQALAEKVKVGSGTLADTATWADHFHEYADHVTSDQRTKEAEQHVEDERLQKVAQDKVTDALLNQWRAGGAVDQTAAATVLRNAGVDNADAVVSTIVNKLPDLDPTNYVGFRSRIFSGNTPSIGELDAAARAHKISDSQYSQLVNEMESARQAAASLAIQGAPTTEGIWNSPAMRQAEASIRAAAATKGQKDMLGNIVSYTGFTENDVQETVNDTKQYLAAWLSQNWNKYSDGRAAAQQAAVAWKGYALQHGVINADEAGLTDQVKPASPIRQEQLKKNQEKQNGPPPYSAAEIHSLRQKLLEFPKMTVEQRRAYLFQPRILAIYQALGSPPIDSLGSVVAEAEQRASHQ